MYGQGNGPAFYAYAGTSAAGEAEKAKKKRMARGTDSKQGRRNGRGLEQGSPYGPSSIPEIRKKVRPHAYPILTDEATTL